MSPKRQIAVALMALAIADGVAAQVVSTPHASAAVALAMGIAISFTYFVWYRVDARQRDYPRSWFLNFGIAGASLIGFPYYFVRTRGLVRGTYATFLFLLSFLGLIICALLGSLLGYFAGL